MVVFLALYAGFIGLFVGSFLLVLIERIPREESFFLKRSHCDSCKKTIPWYDLFPVISYLLLSGRCRFCKKPFSIRYPLMEILTGWLFFLTTWIVFSNTSSVVVLVFALFIMSSLLVTFFVDLEHEIIPFVVIIPASIVTCVYLFLLSPSSFFPHVVSGLGASLFFLLIYFVTRQKGMGFGDVVYVFFMGLLLGFPGIVYGLYIAFLTGAVVSLILIVLRKRKLRGGTIPFGPFLVIGTIAFFFFGPFLESFFSALLGW